MRPLIRGLTTIVPETKSALGYAKPRRAIALLALGRCCFAVLYLDFIDYLFHVGNGGGDLFSLSALLRRVDISAQRQYAILRFVVNFLVFQFVAHECGLVIVLD